MNARDHFESARDRLNEARIAFHEGDTGDVRRALLKCIRHVTQIILRMS